MSHPIASSASRERSGASDRSGLHRQGIYTAGGHVRWPCPHPGQALSAFLQLTFTGPCTEDNQTTHVADSIYVQELQIVAGCLMQLSRLLRVRTTCQDTTPVEQINITLTGELYWS